MNTSSQNHVEGIAPVSNWPLHWTLTTLGAIHRNSAKAIRPSKTPKATFELYSVPAHEIGSPEIVRGEEIGSNKQTVIPNTVLLCKINPRINRVWVIREKNQFEQIASTEWIPFFPAEDIVPKFLAWFLRQATVRDFLASNASGVGGSLMRVKASTLRDYPFPIPAVAEQKRIVEEIETQFTRLDAGVASLKRVQAGQKRYRASVLQAACEGRLVPTEAELARKESLAYEPASDLLAHILKERRAAWESTKLAKLRITGRAPNGDNWKMKYPEPRPPDTRNLPSIPQGWIWTSVDALCFLVTDGEHIQPRYQSSGRPMLSAKNVRDGYVDFSDIDLIAQSDFEQCLKRCAPAENDILVVSVGATTGRTATVGKCEPFAIVRSVLLLKPIVMPTYLLRWLQSPWCQSFILRASGSTAQAHLYIKDAKTIPVPLPPFAEQRRIVAEVERRLSVVDELERIIATNLKRAERLRQCILHRTFRGELG